MQIKLCLSMVVMNELYLHTIHVHVHVHVVLSLVHLVNHLVGKQWILLYMYMYTNVSTVGMHLYIL